MNKKKKILLSIIGVLLLITSIVGVSYAYFTSMIVGNNEASPTVVTTGTMKIEYTNSAEITGEKLLPGWQSETKTFTVKNTGTLPVNYDIRITNVTNTFAKPEELVFKLTRDGETVTEQFPTDDTTLLRQISISSDQIHEYTLQIEFQERGTEQDYNQEKEFYGKIEIVETELAKVIALEGDTSNANAPELNNGLIPVIWNGRNWVKADTAKAWYNYDNGAWANAITVSSASREKYTNAQANATVLMDDIETMWVWVPRFEYQHTNLGDQYAGGTQAQPGGITINFISKDTTTPSSDNFTIHDAFWWDDNNDENKDTNEQLSGIWIAKFEMSAAKTTSNILQAPIIKPNATSWKRAQIGTFWTSIHEHMNGANNQYGLTNTDAHLMKNMEWGAVAYLSQSKYGKYGNADYTGANKEIYLSVGNNGKSYGLPQKKAKTTYFYDIEEKGTGASTTGNIYGIYDMSSMRLEYVMGVMKGKGISEPCIGFDTEYNSGWSGKLYDGTEYAGTYGPLYGEEGVGKKYYDLYRYGITAPETRRLLGDATHETSNWYYNSEYFVSAGSTFFLRGGNYNTEYGAGIFSYYADSGNLDKNYVGRPALVPLN